MSTKLFLALFFLSFSTYSMEKGVGVHPGEFSGTSEEFVGLLKKYKVSSFRTDYPWSRVEKIRGVFSPIDNKTDGIILLSKKNNIKPLLILDYGNDIYNVNKPVSDEEIIKFNNYVSWVVTRFKGTVPIYEIWNEWSMPGPHKITRGLQSAIEYVNLVKNVSAVIRSRDPDAHILAGSFNPTSPDDNEWGKNIVRLGILKYIDGISIHPYLYRGRRNLSSPIIDIMYIKKVHDTLSNIAGQDVNIYITEIGIPSSNNVSFTGVEISNFYNDYMNYVSKLKYVKGVWWYDFIDDGVNKNNDEHNFGILNNDLSEKVIAEKFKEYK